MASIKNYETKLTSAVVDNAQTPDSGDYIIRDTELKGFGVRITSTGQRSWYVDKRGPTVKGVKTRSAFKLKVGSVGAMNLETARKKARAILLDIGNGIDPTLRLKNQLLENEKQRTQEALTVSKIWDAYVTFRSASAKPPKPRTLDDWNSAKNKLELGDLWKMPFCRVTGHDLLVEFNRVQQSAKAKQASNSGRTQAGQVLRYLRAVFNHAKATLPEKPEQDAFDTFNLLEKNWYQTNAKTTIVGNTESELPRWWKAVDELRLAGGRSQQSKAIWADYLQLCLLWGGRRNELLTLRWENVNFTDGYVTFSLTKNGKAHQIPITTHAQAMLENRRKDHLLRYGKENPWVFPSSRKTPEGVEPNHLTEPKKTIEQIVKDIGLDFTVHDLRRTFASFFNDTGASSFTIKKAMNHAPSGVTDKHYVQIRLSTLRPAFQSYEDAILEAAGIKKKQETVSLTQEQYQALLAKLQAFEAASDAGQERATGNA